MPIATLKFKLPEETDEFDTAANAGKLRSGVQAFREWLRSQVKYNDKITEIEQAAYRKTIEQLHEELRDAGAAELID